MDERTRDQVQHIWDAVYAATFAGITARFAGKFHQMASEEIADCATATADAAVELWPKGGEGEAP